MPWKKNLFGVDELNLTNIFQICWNHQPAINKVGKILGMWPFFLPETNRENLSSRLQHQFWRTTIVSRLQQPTTNIQSCGGISMAQVRCKAQHISHVFLFFPSYEIILDLVNDVFSDTSPEKLTWKLKMMASNRVHFQVPLLVFGGL